MTTPEITALPDAPTPQDAPEVFNDKSFRLVAAQAQFVAEANVLAGFVAEAAQAAAGADESAAAANESALAARDVVVDAKAATLEAQAQVSAVATQFGDVAGAIAGAEAAQQGAQAASAQANAADLSSQAAKAQAEAAVIAAELARDASFVTGPKYATEADGRAAVADGVNFLVQGSGDVAAYEYRRVNAGSSTPIATYPAASAVQKPVWAGKINGWPDPFFEHLSAASPSLFNRQRWVQVNGAHFLNYSLVANPTFDGKAVRRAADVGTTGVGGPLIYLDEIGAAEGDTITVYGLFVGDGAVVVAQGRFDNGTDGGWLGIQFDPVNEAGGGTVTASAAAQSLRHTRTVPAGAVRFSFWPRTATAGKAFDLISVWAFKGGATQGPAWPIASTDGSLPARMGLVEQVAATAVSQEGGKINNAVMPYLTYDSPLGAGEMDGDSSYAGKTLGYYQLIGAKALFNAIALRIWASNASTAVEWKVWVRDTATAFNMTSVVAQASGIVAAGAFPTSNSVYRLQLASMLSAAAGKYVFVMFRASDDSNMNMRKWNYNAAITPVRHGFPLYVAGGWNGVFGFSTAGTVFDQPSIQLLLESEEGRALKALGSTAASISYSGASSGLPATDVQQAIDLLAAGAGAPGLVLPPVIYGVQGRECNVYIDNLYLSDSSVYEHDVACAVGAQQAERWNWMPGGALATSSFSITAHEKRTGNALVTNAGVIKAAALAAGSGTNKKVLVIGDSLVQAGTITQTLLDIAATDVMAITLLGTRGVGANQHEGRGGWKVSDYATAGRTFYKFTVSGVVTPPAIAAALYTTNGTNSLMVHEVDLVAGAGTLTCELRSGSAPSGSGTLTKTSSSGDASIAFSAVAPVSGNPFWYSGALNFGQYLTDNGMAAPDFVFIGLGINDVGGAYTTDATASAASDAAFVQLDGLIASIKAAAPSVKIGLVLPTPPASSQDAFGANYLSGIVRFRLKRNVLIWSRQCIAKYGADASNIYIVPSNTALDTVNNVSRAVAAPVNSRSDVLVARQNNAVHPPASGYQQIADSWWAFLKFFA